MDLKFFPINKNENDDFFEEEFNKYIFSHLEFKDILIVNTHDKLIEWMFEKSFKTKSGIAILQLNNQDSLDNLVSKNKFKYLLLPKKYSSILTSTEFIILKSFNIYQTEYIFIEIKNLNEYVDFRNSIVLFTSGSSGDRKPVIISHKSIIACSKFMAEEMKMNINDKEIIYGQLDHAFSLGRLLSCAISHSKYFFISSKNILKPSNIEKFLQIDGLSGFSTMPSVLYSILLNENYAKEFSKRLKYVQIGTMFFPEVKKLELVKKLPKTKIYSNYGSTEYMRATFFEISKNLNKSHTEGKASRATEIKIEKIGIEYQDKLNLNNREKNLIGEILIKGAHLSSGYMDTLEWEKKITHDGYFKSGDIGYLDEDGFLIHKGRKDNVFNFQGKLFSTTSLQAKLEETFSVLENESIIIPIRKKDSIKDTEIKLIISNNFKNQQELPSEKEIKKFFSNFGLKITIIYLNFALPRTGNGKIAYGKIKDFLNTKTNSDVK